MTENNNEKRTDITGKLNSETAKIAWTELQTFFAKGMVIYVSHKLDLIEVATELSRDNKTVFEVWMAENMVGNVSDEQASAWLESNILVWAVVVHPWVLVQPVVD